MDSVVVSRTIVQAGLRDGLIRNRSDEPRGDATAAKLELRVAIWRSLREQPVDLTSLGEGFCAKCVPKLTMAIIAVQVRACFGTVCKPATSADPTLVLQNGSVLYAAV